MHQISKLIDFFLNLDFIRDTRARTEFKVVIILNGKMQDFLFFYCVIVVIFFVNCIFHLVLPVWREKPASQQVTEGQAVTYTCEVEGIPAPSTHWYYNGRPWKGT